MNRFIIGARVYWGASAAWVGGTLARDVFREQVSEFNRPNYGIFDACEGGLMIIGAAAVGAMIGPIGVPIYAAREFSVWRDKSTRA
jgi:hypothetical protein